jgi:DNA (cytosine-5)-methyltransferase 1
MKVLDLFSGVGGFSIGLERAGMKTVAFCENDPFCRAILEQHWPGVPCYDDVRSISAKRLGADGIKVEGICGGFPCQDVSAAGKGAGLAGERSGLWSDFARLIGDLRPKFVIVENVSALVIRGLDRVLGDLAEIGYDAEYEVLGADAIGASQRRERVWILAYPHGTRREGGIWAAQPHQARPEWKTACREPLRSGSGFWPPGPGAVNDIPRMVDGSANRSHRLTALGNAVVPQIAEIIGREIMAKLGAGLQTAADSIAAPAPVNQ